MNEKIDALCAELRALDYWEWLYQQAIIPTEADVISHRLRQARRTEITSELQGKLDTHSFVSPPRKTALGQ